MIPLLKGYETRCVSYHNGLLGPKEGEIIFTHMLGLRHAKTTYVRHTHKYKENKTFGTVYTVFLACRGGPPCTPDLNVCRMFWMSYFPCLQFCRMFWMSYFPCLKMCRMFWRSNFPYLKMCRMFWMYLNVIFSFIYVVFAETGMCPDTSPNFFPVAAID